MKQIILIAWFLFAYTTISLGQVITLKNSESGDPVYGATLRDGHTAMHTNSDGQADISAFRNSERIEIRANGYETVHTTYTDLSRSAELQLTPTVLQLEDMVVSATRWDQKTSDVPSKIITVSSADIALQNPQTAADLLGSSGKVFIQKSQQGGGSPMIRGFATNRLLYTVDGVRMNTAIFRGGNIQNVISLDPFSMESAEVVFGPGSVIYGSDAIGGVMSFQTLAPQFTLNSKPLVTGKAVTRYSSANQEKTAHFDINVGWKKWSILTSISANDFEDLKMGSYGPSEYLRPFYVQRVDSTDVVVTNDDPKKQRPSGYSQINMMQKIRFAPNEKWDIQYGFHYSETSEYSRYDRHIRYKNGLPRYGEWNYGPQKWMMNNLNVTHHGKNAVYDEMTIRLAQQSFEESRISRDINKFNRETRIEEVSAYSANLDFVKHIGNKNTLYYGVETVWNDVRSTGIDEDISTGEKVAGAARYPQSTWASYGVYVNDQHQFSDKFLLQGGMRYNYYGLDATFDTTFYPFPFTEAHISNGALTGSLGFVLRPTARWVISLNAGTAFRSPNVDDVGKVFDSEPGSVTVPNPDLEAEYAYNVDLGIARMFGKWVKVDVTGYYTILQNALVRRDYTLNGMDSIMYDGELSRVQAIQNAAVATVYGIQAGLEINLSKGFSLTSDFNYQMGEEEQDDGTRSPSRHAAPWYGVTRLNYSYGRLKLQLYGVYSGEKTFDQLPEEEKGKTEIYAIDSNGNPYSPGWYTLNFKAMYNFEKNFGVSAGIENITDQRYRPYSSGIAAAGRNFILSLRMNF